jgi:hypothetical protein
MTVDELYTILGNLPRGMRINIVTPGSGRRSRSHALGAVWIDEEGEAADEAYGVLYIGAGRALGVVPEEAEPVFAAPV